MVQKKKLSQQEKRLRRLKEVKKAVSRVDTRVSGNAKASQETITEKLNESLIVDRQTLPIKEIKKDLWKNFGFLVFAVTLVVTLKLTGFGFQEIKHLLNL